MLEITEYFSELHKHMVESIQELERGDFTFVDFMYYLSTKPSTHLNSGLVFNEFETIDFILSALKP